ncbi:MAG: metal-dependent phosphohydrolase, partial [Spirulinaceae cyanobacterium]
MFNLTQERIDSCVRRLQGGYFRIYGSSRAEYAELIASVARIGLDNIARSDAAYHDVDHTILVTLAGQE